MRLRIAVVAAVGIGLIGIYAWPLIAPEEPYGIVSVVSGTISSNDGILLIVLGFAAGLISYFLAWPYGKQIGILAAPAGLGFLAARSGNMGTLIQLNPAIIQREELYSAICWEPLLWLGVVFAGFLGTFVASEIIYPVRPEIIDKFIKRDFGYFVNLLVVIIGSVVITQFFIGILARDYTAINPQGGSAVGQSALGQIIFAVFVSFGLAGFLAKNVLNLDYTGVIISSFMVNPVSIMIYARHNVVSYFAGHWPAVFFPNATLTILPIQIVSFGAIGAVAGYWIAIYFDYWRKNEA